jgi:hypothetical protein
MPRHLSSDRRPPRRAETLPVRFASDAVTQPRLREPRRERAYLQRTGSQFLDQDLEGGEPVLQKDSDDDLYRGIYGDSQQSRRNGNHDHSSRVFSGYAPLVNEPESVLPGAHRENDESDETIILCDPPPPPTVGPLPPPTYGFGLPTYGPPPLPRLSQHHSKHRHHHVLDFDQWSDTGSDGYVEAYDFNLSRENKSPLIPDSSTDSVTEVSENAPIMSEAQNPASGSKPLKVLHVIRSQYTGDGATGGLQAAQLTAMHDANQIPRKGVQPLLRWMSVNPSVFGI